MLGRILMEVREAARARRFRERCYVENAGGRIAGCRYQRQCPPIASLVMAAIPMQTPHQYTWRN